MPKNGTAFCTESEEEIISVGTTITVPQYFGLYAVQDYGGTKSKL
jgi:3D (Asp-Asp-Asp) domain-containing protein